MTTPRRSPTKAKPRGKARVWKGWVILRRKGVGWVNETRLDVPVSVALSQRHAKGWRRAFYERVRVTITEVPERRSSR